MKLSDAEIAKIKSHRQQAEKSAALFWELAREICQQYNVKPGDLSAPTRGEEAVCAARDMVCYIASGRGWSKSAIGRMIRRDPSTVSHAVAKMVERLGPLPQSETPAK